MSQDKPYPDVTPSPKFPAIEEQTLAYWGKNKIFEKSVASKPSSINGKNNEFVFYDGPPFANGLPHYGHLLTGFVKDIVPRYQTMLGKKVERRFGWDCHGLPAEMEVEKEIKVSGRQAIQEYGIDKFNEQCRKSVLKYTHEWERYVTRQSRWVSFENDYKTMDLSYMESVIWAFGELYKKGLVYEGYRVMPYSWACETPLSNFEIRLDNAYRSRQDPAVTVALDLEDKSAKVLIWTTTPWTLPSNLAIAVGKDIEYAEIRHNNASYILAKEALPRYEANFKGAEIIRTLKGAELIGKKYTPPFSYFLKHENAFQIIEGDFVTTEDGVGLVHLAPGFGEDDQRVCEAQGIEIVCPVDVQGKFTSEITEFAGRQVQEANKDIIRNLKDRGLLIRHDTIEHNYPHCWRTDTPLIYKAVSSWYVRVTDFRDRMVELNQQINWIPSHIKDGQFGKWLSNARDWSISRNRFWGTPIPIWRSDDPKYPRVDVYSNIASLEKDFGVKVTDLHRPFIDSLTRPNPDDPTGKSTMRRVEEVFDCWFESGSMPYAQFHYPFENKEWFEGHFPSDFIVEYVAQTRGWFYTMMVLSTAIFDKPPFLNCMCHGVVLDEDGQKLSKRLRNYPDPEEVFRTIGADALRWFLVASPILRGGDLNIDRDGKGIQEIVRTVINPFWNAYYFFTLYANTDGIKATFSTDSKQLLDRYILSKTKILITNAQKAMDEYDIAKACQEILQFIDALNNWYIRRSRDRFWRSGKDQDKVDAYNTLYTVFITLLKIAAPVLPLITEEIYRGLTGEESIHLSEWPEESQFNADETLAKEMDLVRDICSIGLSLREAHSLRTRLPLRNLTVAGPGLSAIKHHSQLLKDELNVKEVHFEENAEKFASYQLTVNARALGPRLGEKMKEVIKLSKEGKWSKLADGTIEVCGEKLLEGEFSLKFVSKEGFASQALSAANGVVVLDTKVTPELEEEGYARDLVRLIQQARKDVGLHIADYISLTLGVDDKVQKIITNHKQYVSEQTLAKAVEVTKAPQKAVKDEWQIAGNPISIDIRKI